MTVKIHYLDGSTFTYSGCYVDAWINWDGLTFLIDGGGNVLHKVATCAKDILFIEEIDLGCGTTILRHPTVRPMSIKVDVMTANSRCKANRGGGNK